MCAGGAYHHSVQDLPSFASLTYIPQCVVFLLYLMYLISISPCAGGAYQQNVQDLKGPTVKRVEIFNLGKDNQADHPGAWQQAEAEGRTERANGKATHERVSLFWGGGTGRGWEERHRHRGESPRFGKRGEPSIYRMKGRGACVSYMIQFSEGIDADL